MVIGVPDVRVAAKHVSYGENSLESVINDINRIYRESQQQPKASAPN